MTNLKSLINRFIPRPVHDLIIRWRASRIQHHYSALSLAETFDLIYSSNAWRNSGTAPLSGRGSTGRYIEDYCRLMRNSLDEFKVETVVDLGCGDFNTGRAIAGIVADYTGVDIAQKVIEANTLEYSTDHIHFVRADVTRDLLPPASAAIVRQVLQHLNNSEIRSALDNIRRVYPLTFVTEHIYIGPGYRPNLDYPHGPGTRVTNKSGVFIDCSPFNVRARLLGDIECRLSEEFGPHEVLRTWVIEA